MGYVEEISLNDGRKIPQIGLGVWQLDDEQTYTAVRAAIHAGYRQVDTAAIYRNEEAVGRAVADAISAGDVTREELFITTKLWNSDQLRGEEAFAESARKLGMDYVDLYLLHWPLPQNGTFVQAYESMMAIRDAGKTRSIGVCNFYSAVLDTLIDAVGETPAINQIEIHPGFSQEAQRADNSRRGIVTQAWSPLGQGKNLSDPTIVSIAQELGVSAAQVIIRWHIQRGDVVIPRSSHAQRIVENFQVFDFELSQDQMGTITALDRQDGRVGPDPLEFHRQ